MAKQIRAEWAKLGCLLTTEGAAPGKAVVTHPLVTLLLNVERDAQRFSHEAAVQSRDSVDDPTTLATAFSVTGAI